jgi:hypothetical protein
LVRADFRSSIFLVLPVMILSSRNLTLRIILRCMVSSPHYGSKWQLCILREQQLIGSGPMKGGFVMLVGA